MPFAKYATRPAAVAAPRDARQESSYRRPALIRASRFARRSPGRSHRRTRWSIFAAAIAICRALDRRQMRKFGAVLVERCDNCAAGLQRVSSFGQPDGQPIVVAFIEVRQFGDRQRIRRVDQIAQSGRRQHRFWGLEQPVPSHGGWDSQQAKGVGYIFATLILSAKNCDVGRAQGTCRSVGPVDDFHCLGPSQHQPNTVGLGLEGNVPVVAVDRPVIQSSAEACRLEAVNIRDLHPLFGDSLRRKRSAKNSVHESNEFRSRATGSVERFISSARGLA